MLLQPAPREDHPDNPRKIHQWWPPPMADTAQHTIHDVCTMARMEWHYWLHPCPWLWEQEKTQKNTCWFATIDGLTNHTWLQQRVRTFGLVLSVGDMLLIPNRPYRLPTQVELDQLPTLMRAVYRTNGALLSTAGSMGITSVVPFKGTTTWRSARTPPNIPVDTPRLLPRSHCWGPTSSCTHPLWPL